jgi:DNA-binding transcriptional ArsR family regulator
MVDPELIPLVARRFKALGEPGRLALLVALQEGERSVSELVSLTGRTQPNVSQHLKQMAHAGLVAARREGARVFYGICDPYLSRICDAVCRSVRDAHEALDSAVRPARRPRARPGARGARAGSRVRRRAAGGAERDRA